MYLEAKQCERELSVQVVNDVAETIKAIVSTILNEIDEETDTILAEIPKGHETLESLFEEGQEASENLSKLMFLVDHVEEVLQKVKDGQSLSIKEDSDPMFGIEITLDQQGKFEIQAYSNIDNDFMWDELVTWLTVA
jgi:hypothetical protein